MAATHKYFRKLGFTEVNELPGAMRYRAGNVIISLYDNILHCNGEVIMNTNFFKQKEIEKLLPRIINTLVRKDMKKYEI